MGQLVQGRLLWVIVGICLLTAMSGCGRQRDSAVATTASGSYEESQAAKKASVAGVPNVESPRSLPWLAPDTTPRLALIIDDWGQQRAIEERFLELDMPCTVAVIPHLANSAADAEMAAAAGCDVMLHLPMEPVEGDYSDMKGLITTDMSDTAVAAAFTEALAEIPGVIGVNNHMGSKATADVRVMRIVLQEARRHRLLFVDSKTTAASVAAPLGDDMGVPVLERQVFLDGNSDTAYIHNQLLAAAKLAKEQGYAVAIGHVRANTAQALQTGLKAVEEMGVRLVRISELVRNDWIATAPL